MTQNFPKVTNVTTVYPLVVDLLNENGQSERLMVYIDAVKGEIFTEDENLKQKVLLWMSGETEEPEFDLGQFEDIFKASEEEAVEPQVTIMEADV